MKSYHVLCSELSERNPEFCFSTEVTFEQIPFVIKFLESKYTEPFITIAIKEVDEEDDT